jgi:hypothetical protein
MSHQLTPKLQSELANNGIIKKLDQFTAKVFHAVNPGDLISAMGAIRKYWQLTGRKVVVIQSTQQLAAYYQGASHPTVNEYGENVCCNQQMLQMLKPLIESQEYVHSFEKYEGQKFDLDFNTIRGKTQVNLPHGAIQNWVPLAFPDLAFDISEKWIDIPDECPEHIKEQVKGKVLLNFTERYRNPSIDYFFLQNYAPDLIFAGTEREHWLFTNTWNVNIPRLQVNDFLELAHAIKNARFLLGNQSFNWNLANAMQAPRLLELCSFAQNCIHNIGKYNFGYFYQIGVEHYFRLMYKELK